MNELTSAQLSQQDYVEGVLHAMLEELACKDLEFDKELICDLRDIISARFAKRDIMTEMEFYPFC